MAQKRDLFTFQSFSLWPYPLSSTIVDFPQEKKNLTIKKNWPIKN